MRELNKKALRIFSICIALIFIYSVATLIFAAYCESRALIMLFLPEMLHSSAISLILALGGTLLIDLELLRQQNLT